MTTKLHNSNTTSPKDSTVSVSASLEAFEEDIQSGATNETVTAASLFDCEASEDCNDCNEED